jgi:hypothetical protein
VRKVGKTSNASTAVNCESQRVRVLFPHPQGSRLLGVRAQEETAAAVFYSQVESVCWGWG